MDKTHTDSLPLLFKESGSTSKVDNPSSSISECLIDVTLPEELITEILVRLPVKSLSRFKCVSKPWLSLISNPQFIRSHLSKSSSMEADEMNLELLFVTETSMKKCSLYSALHEADPYAPFSAVDIPSLYHDSIVGIINGLVCLKLKGIDLCVWNPSLNKTKHFNFHPEAPSSYPLSCLYSFGYEESNDDYKVVCLHTGQGNDGVFYDGVCIYSLKSDSWRRIDGLKAFLMPYPGVFAYGKIYWCGDLFATPNGKIVTLDMSREKFVEMQQPEYDAGECILKMEVSGGRPFVLCHYYEARKLDLWVLDKHGVDESWCKFVSIPYTDVNNTLNYLKFVCISRNGEILCGGKYGLIVYNRKKKEYRNIELNVGIKTVWRMVAYVESLVWPYHPQCSMFDASAKAKLSCLVRSLGNHRTTTYEL